MPMWIAILELAALPVALVLGFALGRASRSDVRFDEFDPAGGGEY